MHIRRSAAALAVLATCAALTACTGSGSDAEKAPHPPTPTAATPATATSAAELGGMDALVAAAQKEGRLNVIGLPPDLVNFRALIDGFTRTYGIEVTSARPDASSQEEIDTARTLEGRDTVPDVFDIGQAVALANLDLFARYRVATWDDIPAEFKQADGAAVGDYGGYMSIGYDAGTVPEIHAVGDLLSRRFAGKVALTGDPTESNAALNAVRMVAVARGGSAADLGPGVEFFSRLQRAGKFVATPATDATVLAGQTPVVLDWDYLSARTTAKLPTWKVVVPGNAPVAGYYYQAINEKAAHPAAARLWEEYLYSDQGQNLWLQGGARPVRLDAMVRAGTVDKAAYDKLPRVSGEPILPTPEDDAKAADYLATSWARAIG